MASRIRSRPLWVGLLSFVLGIVIGGNLFSASQPRSFTALTRCSDCLDPRELAGLVASVGIQKAPGLIPLVAMETDRTLVLRLPAQEGVHYVIVPRRDLRDIADVSSADAPYLVDAFRVVRELVRKERFTRYTLTTNGGANQQVRYLHFHLRGK